MLTSVREWRVKGGEMGQGERWGEMGQGDRGESKGERVRGEILVGGEGGKLVCEMVEGKKLRPLTANNNPVYHH